MVKTRDGSTLFDNLAIRCLEELRARPEGYKFFDTCVQTDGDGDKIYMTYEGPESGPVEWLGGTGKIRTSPAQEAGRWRTRRNTSSLFAFTLSYEVSWTQKEK